MQQPTTHDSLKNDADDEFYSVQKDTLLVNYAQSDYLSTYTATLPRQDLFVRSTKTNFDPIQTSPIIPHPNWLFPQKKTNLRKISRSVFFYSTSEKQGDCKN